MGTVAGFVLMLLIVLLVAACGMWLAQTIAARLGRKAPLEFESRPAAPLGAAEDAAHHPSPDGRFDVVTVAVARRMSRRVQTPSLVQVGGNRTLFALDERWSADEIAWSADSRHVTLKLRKSPSDVPGVTLVADLLAGEARFETRAGAETVPLADADAWLAAYVRRFGT